MYVHLYMYLQIYIRIHTYICIQCFAVSQNVVLKVSKKQSTNQQFYIFYGLQCGLDAVAGPWQCLHSQHSVLMQHCLVVEGLYWRKWTAEQRLKPAAV